VKPATFGKLYSCAVDGAVYAQPLWVANLNFGGVKHNVLFVATQRNTLYAFDADSSSCAQLWSASLLGAGETFVTAPDDLQGCTDLMPDVGIVGTPVIDAATKTIYAISKSKNISSGTIVQRIHALDLITGLEKFGGPTVVAGGVPTATFDA